MAKPLIAIVNTWSTVTPCNIHLKDLADHARRGIAAAGATPIDFNTIVVTDGIAMGTPGHARVADEPRDHRGFGRTGGAGAHARRGAVPRRVRQDDSGGGDGRCPPRSAQCHPLRRLDHAGAARRPGADDPGRVRGGRRARRGQPRRRRAERGRGRGLPRRGGVRRAVHRQHDGTGDDLPGAVADGAERHSGGVARQAGRRRGGRTRFGRCGARRA